MASTAAGALLTLNVGCAAPRQRQWYLLSM
jgi:hypothetical protein